MKNIAIVLVLIFISISSVAQNPLFSRKKVESSSEKIDKENEATKSKFSFTIPLISKLIRENSKIQKKIKSKFVNIANDYKSSSSLKTIAIIFGLAFLYGLFHSLGPGHGKLFIFSYILTEKPKVLKAITVSYAIAAVHALSGLLVSLVLIYFFKEFSTYSYSVSVTPMLITKISFFLLILIGIFMLYKSLVKSNSKTDEKRKIHLIPFILSVGLVPCPGTIIIVLFLASMGLVAVSIVSVFFMVLGMGLTISVIGIISIYSKSLILKFTTRTSESSKYSKVYKWFSIFGSSLIIIFALLMFIGSFS